MPQLPSDWLTIQHGRFTLQPILAKMPLSIGECDMVMMAALNRAAAMALGFHSLVSENNFICASALVRLQLDNALRAFAVMTAANSEDAAGVVKNGGCLRDLMSRDGKRMTDNALAMGMNAFFQETGIDVDVSRLYANACGYIHFSEEALKRTWALTGAPGPGATAEFSLGNPAAYVGTDDWDKLIGDFELASHITYGILRGWMIFRQGGSRP